MELRTGYEFLHPWQTTWPSAALCSVHKHRFEALVPSVSRAWGIRGEMMEAAITCRPRNNLIYQNASHCRTYDELPHKGTALGSLHHMGPDCGVDLFLPECFEVGTDGFL